MLEYSLPRLFVLWKIRSRDRSFPGTFVPEMKHCRPFRAFPPRTIRSLDRSFPETFVPGTLAGPFLPRTIRSFVGTTRKAIGKLNKAIDKLSADLALVYVHDKFPVQYICYSIDHCPE